MFGHLNETNWIESLQRPPTALKYLDTSKPFTVSTLIYRNQVRPVQHNLVNFFPDRFVLPKLGVKLPEAPDEGLPEEEYKEALAKYWRNSDNQAAIQKAMATLAEREYRVYVKSAFDAISGDGKSFYALVKAATTLQWSVEAGSKLKFVASMIVPIAAAEIEQVSMDGSDEGDYSSAKRDYDDGGDDSEEDDYEQPPVVSAKGQKRMGGPAAFKPAAKKKC